MRKSAFDEENTPYTEVFKGWLEKNHHTSILELLDWEVDGSKIKLGLNYGETWSYWIHNWHLYWKVSPEDKEEKELELKILLYQWLKDVQKEKSPGLRQHHQRSCNERIEKYQNRLTNHRYWKKKKKHIPIILGVIIISVITLYL